MSKIDQFLKAAQDDGRHESQGHFTIKAGTNRDTLAKFLEQDPSLALIRWIQGAIALGASQVTVGFGRSQITINSNLTVPKELMGDSAWHDPENLTASNKRASEHWRFAVLLAGCGGQTLRARLVMQDQANRATLTLQDNAMKWATSTAEAAASASLEIDFHPRCWGLLRPYPVTRMLSRLQHVFACWTGRLMLDGALASAVPLHELLGIDYRESGIPLNFFEHIELSSEPQPESFLFPVEMPYNAFNWVAPETECLSTVGFTACQRVPRCLWIGLEAQASAPQLGWSNNLTGSIVGCLPGLGEAVLDRNPSDYDIANGGRLYDFKTVEKNVVLVPHSPSVEELGASQQRWNARAAWGRTMKGIGPETGKLCLIQDGALLEPVSVFLRNFAGGWIFRCQNETPTDLSGRNPILSEGLAGEIESELTASDKIYQGHEARRRVASKQSLAGLQATSYQPSDSLNGFSDRPLDNRIRGFTQSAGAASPIQVLPKSRGADSAPEVAASALMLLGAANDHDPATLIHRLKILMDGKERGTTSLRFLNGLTEHFRKQRSKPAWEYRGWRPYATRQSPEKLPCLNRLQQCLTQGGAACLQFGCYRKESYYRISERWLMAYQCHPERQRLEVFRNTLGDRQTRPVELQEMPSLKLTGETIQPHIDAKGYLKAVSGLEELYPDSVVILDGVVMLWPDPRRGFE